jgi:3-methylfumaryl-CoA hydratase
MTDIDIESLQQWVGRTHTRCDVISAAPVAALSASLNLPAPRAVVGAALPACWHWLYFQEVVPTSRLTPDGHAPRGDFLPPVPMPRRMWAGSRLRIAVPLLVGDEARRVSTVQSVTHKQGRSGDLVFVTLRHQVFCRQILAIDEEQHLVYRDQRMGDDNAQHSSKQTAKSTTETSLPLAQWRWEVSADTVLLFRYSALTFNSHRIHYDRDYAMREEGYGGLVVQGPLTATLLLELLNRELPSARVSTFEFRAARPLLAETTMLLQGRREKQEVRLWALDANGELATEAWATLSSGKT